MRYQPQADTVMRMHTQTAMIEKGSGLARRIPARADFLSARPARRPGPPGHSVPVATAQMLDCFKRAGAEPQHWMWQLYIQQHRAEEPHNPRPEPLSVIARRLGLLR
jgi:hypothetical protein